MLQHDIFTQPYYDSRTLKNGVRVECIGVSSHNFIEYEIKLVDFRIQLPVRIDHSWTNDNTLKIVCPETVIEGDYPNQSRVDVNELQPHFDAAAKMLEDDETSVEMLISKTKNVYQIVVNMRQPINSLFIIQLRIPYRYRLQFSNSIFSGLVVDIVPAIQLKKIHRGLIRPFSLS